MEDVFCLNKKAPACFLLLFKRAFRITEAVHLLFYGIKKEPRKTDLFIQ